MTIVKPGEFLEFSPDRFWNRDVVCFEKKRKRVQLTIGDGSETNQG